MSGSALADFLRREEIGPPLDAERAGQPQNAPASDLGAAGDEYPRDLAELHRRLVRRFEEAESMTSRARQLSERDRDYVDNYDDDQWSNEEKLVLRDRGQPITTTNYIRRGVDLLCGMERKARTDPKAFARTPQEEDRADAATQALRYIGDACDMPVLASAVYRNLLVEGTGGTDIALVEDGKGGLDIRLTHVPWDRIWFDPYSRAADFSDARYVGLVAWKDLDELEETYPGAAYAVEASFEGERQTYRDRPAGGAWTDNRRRRLRVVQCHWQEQGRWWCATYAKGGLLAEPYPSPFKDRDGRSTPGLKLCSAYVNRDNFRFGMVRDLISQQDAINKRESKSLHLLAVNQVVLDRGAVDDEDETRKQAAKPDGLIVKNPGFELEILRGTEMATAHFQMLQHAIAQMQTAAPNASMSGTDPRQLSGRAILAQQAGGATQNEPLMDVLREWKRRVYETCWMAAREYWGADRWLRITDETEGATRWVGLNRHITLAEELALMQPEQRAMQMQRMMIVPGDPRLGMVVRVENDISDLEVDITIEEGADVPALQAEQFQALTQLAGAQPGLIPGDILIQASNLKDKGKLLERLKQNQEAQAAGMAGQQQMQQAELRGKHAKASADEALALERTHGALGRIAETERLATEAPYVPVGPVGVPKEEPKPPPG